MVKKFTTSKSGLKQGNTVDINMDANLSGWVPLMVADITSNHTGSFSITQHRIMSDGKVYVTAYSQSNWADLTLSCTVLYAKAPFIVSREYI